jgi:WD40 repeat protein
VKRLVTGPPPAGDFGPPERTSHARPRLATIGATVNTPPSFAARLLLALALVLPALLPQPARAQADSDAPTLVVEIGSHSAPARRIDVHAGRKLAVTASDDRTARVWDLATGELRHVLRPLAFGALGGEVGRLYGAAIHPTEPLVAVAGTSSAPGQPGTTHQIYLFNLDSGALQRTIDARAGDIRKLVWSADGTVLLAGYNGTNGVRAFALDGRELLDDRLNGPVFGIAVGAGSVAAAVALDGTVRTYRVGAGAASVAGTLMVSGKRPAGVSFAPDGTRFVVAYATPREAPEVFETAGPRVLSKLEAPVLRAGDWRVVAWSHDGRRIHIGGTAYADVGGRLRFPVVEIDAASGRVAASVDAAGDSITDLAALPGDGVAYTSFDASWGVIAGRQVQRSVGAPVVTVRGDTPLDFELSADARALRWGVQTGSGVGFAFDKRRLQPSPGTAYRRPETRFGLFSAPSDWSQEQRPPVIGGRAMALASDERGRALAVVRGANNAPSAAIIGTNRALYRVSEQGATVWRVAVDTEVRALNTSADGRIVVSAMADGTVRWWRASDGRLLLTLLAQSSGQWVVWTPAGYYDASAGADRVVGWALPRGQQQAMSYFSLNRFRDRFLRPDVIDAMFVHLDEAAAVAALGQQADETRLAQERETRAQAEAAKAAEQRAADEARRAAQREAELKAAAEQAARDAAARAEAQRRAEAEAARLATAAAAEQARQAEAARLAQQREAELRARADAAAREAEARAEAARQAEARRQAAAAQAQAEREAAAREAERRQAEAREAAERERQLREAATRAEQERLAEARRQEQQRAAEREAARQEAARRQTAEREAREAAERERVQREAALEAQRMVARLEQARAAAALEAALREEAAKVAAREAAERAAADKARRALHAMKAVEFPPTLTPVAQPKLRATAQATEVSLPFALLSAAAAGDVTITLRVNGRPVPAGDVIMPKSVDGRTQGTVKLPSAALLEARSQVELIASNRYGISEALAFTVERDFPPGARPPSGDLYVLAIGVAEYARREYNLGLAAKDARDFAASMARQEGRQYQRVVVRTLTNREATRAAVLRELETLRASVTGNDVAMVFIAGHGVNDSSGNYYFLPHDGQHERLATTAVPQAALVSGLSKIKGKTILFVDTCFAGNALGALSKVTRATEGLINDLSSSENGVVVFASSTGHEESEEKDEWGNGAFTKAVLEGLSGKADFTRAGRVTYAALNLFVSEEVTRLTAGRQRPVFISPRGIPDFALARL